MESRALRQTRSKQEAPSVQEIAAASQDGPPKKKRRAAFGDITNKEDKVVNTGKGGKKKGITQVIAPPSAENLTNQTSNKPADKTLPNNKCNVQSPNETLDTSDVKMHCSSAKPEDSEIIDLCTRFDYIDVDKENEDSPYHVTEYVNDIFNYYKQREVKFAVSNYMEHQSELTSNMRAILVDWLVEVQQNFELNHETLYMAVKLVDKYLEKEQLAKDKLQLLGATSLSIGCKFEERTPPLLDDFMYVCDDAYSRYEMIDMETSILKVVGFDLGMPLSYTFLRRYAQGARVTLKTLTLSRFILESSLVDYSYYQYAGSMMASACLLLAMKMNREGSWDSTMVHYSGYRVQELVQLSRKLNAMISTPSKSLNAVRTKYSHSVFNEVAKIPPLNELSIQSAFTEAALTSDLTQL